VTAPTGRGATAPAGRQLLRAAGAAVGAALLVSAVVESVRLGEIPFLDLQVYRAAVGTWWSGSSPYDPTYVGGLVFNYPPTSLPLLAPLAIGPLRVVGVLLAITGAACLVPIYRWLLPGVGWSAVLLAAGITAQTEPFLTTWAYGQVDVLLLVAVVAGVVVARRPAAQGVLVGAAAGVKLTPGVVAVILVVRRQWRSLAWMAASLSTLAVVASLRTPGVVVDWLSRVTGDLVVVRPVDADRVESWSGLVRATLGDGWRPLALAVAAAVVVLGVVVAVVRARRDDVVGALAALVLTTVLATSVTWTHHWIWLPVLVATVRRHGPWRPADVAHLVAVTALALAMLAWVPEWFSLPDHGLAVAGGAWLASYSYVLLGTAVLATLAWTTADRRGAERLS
jgi:hypothetical protein